MMSNLSSAPFLLNLTVIASIATLVYFSLKISKETSRKLFRK